MKYKVGDKVRVRKDLEEIKVYGSETAVNCMVNLRGKVVTIAECLDWRNVYKIKEDVGNFHWTDEMFEGLANEAPSIVRRINNKHDILNGRTNTDTLKPDYYKYRGGDVFDMAKHFELDYPLGSALKYLLRAGHKNPAKKIEDLQKCIECIKRHIELEGRQ